MFITGIGSRETPRPILDEMTKIGEWIANNGHTLRSGHADGADLFFEMGASGAAEIFLPWSGFNKTYPVLGKRFVFDKDSSVAPQCRELILKHHPAPRALSRGAWFLMGRNCFQILGPDLTNPSSMVICWTKGGKLIGGTSFAMRIAMEYKIPIINMAVDTYRTANSVIEYINENNKH